MEIERDKEALVSWNMLVQGQSMEGTKQDASKEAVQ
jgi:hypothetical protein